MQKRIKPAARHPKAGDTIPLVVTGTVEVRNETPAANQPKRGKLNYQAKPKKSAPKPKQSAAKTHQRVERRSVAKGKYIGDGQQLTAFVWLDDETVPSQEAGNDPR